MYEWEKDQIKQAFYASCGVLCFIILTLILWRFSIYFHSVNILLYGLLGIIGSISAIAIIGAIFYNFRDYFKMKKQEKKDKQNIL
jgi:hypothetical protein